MYYKVFLTIITAALLSGPAQQAFAAEPTTAAPAIEAKTEAAAADAKDSKAAAKEAKAEAKEAKQAAKSAEKAAKQPGGVSQAEQEKLDTATINASNEINGQKVDPKVMKKPKKKGFTLQSLNPIGWLLKPVTDTQKTVIELQKQIVRLEAPIANLQKPMVGLRTDMQQVDSTMDQVNAKMNQMHGDINNIHTGMKSVDGRIAHMERQLGQMYEPIVQLKNPVIALKDPVLGVGNQLTTLKADLKELKDVVSFTTTAILAAVLIVGVLIAVGTPIVALFAWRHRRWIMQKFGREDVSGKAEPTSETPEDEQKALAKKEENQQNTKRAA